MAANTTPIFTITPKLAGVRISTANTARDGTGSLGDLITGGTNGTRIDRIVCMAGGTTTVGMLRFFIYDGSANSRFWLEVPVAAITPSATVQAFRAVVMSPDPNQALLNLPVNYILRVGTHNAETFDVIPHAGDY